jgi:hypothetical protein
MSERNLARVLRSPAASTVFAVVFGLGGLAIAGSRTYDAPDATNPPGRASAAVHAVDEATHGPVVSSLATGSDQVGWRKGEVVSDVASDGTSQAGEHGPHGGVAGPDTEAAGHGGQSHGGHGGGSHEPPVTGPGPTASPDHPTTPEPSGGNPATTGGDVNEGASNDDHSDDGDSSGGSSRSPAGADQGSGRP